MLFDFSIVIGFRGLAKDSQNWVKQSKLCTGNVLGHISCVVNKNLSKALVIHTSIASQAITRGSPAHLELCRFLSEC